MKNGLHACFALTCMMLGCAPADPVSSSNSEVRDVLRGYEADVFTWPLDPYPLRDGCLEWGGYNSVFPGKRHVADDACVAAGTRAYAVARGVVTYARERGTCADNWGDLTILEVATTDGRTRSFLYGHCRAVVAEGDVVELGQHICNIVDYRSFGPCAGWWHNHLHFGDYEGSGLCAGRIPQIGEYPCWASGYIEESVWPGSYRDSISFLREHAVTPSRHPPGTLVQVPDHSDPALRPRIYQVCGDGELCWVTNEDNFLSRRFYHSYREPWVLVVPITEDEFECYRMGRNLDYPLTMRFTRCREGNASELRYVEQTYLTVNERGVLGRWRVPFVPDDDRYGILLRSWGFGTEEVLSEYEGCGYPLQTDLVLRDGTVVELASDNDFYVVSGGGYAYRLMRGLAWALRYSSGQILQAPDGSLPALVRGVHHDDSDFSVVDATQCDALIPSGGPGGGSVGSDAGSPFAPDAGTYFPSPADAGLEESDSGPPMLTCTPTVESCNGRDDDCDGVADEGLSCGGGLHTVRIRFCPGVDGWLTTGLPDRHDEPVYRFAISGGCADRTFANNVASGTYQINAEYAGPTWECNEYPAGSIWLRHGTPEAWVDGVSTPLTWGHDPTIRGGTGCNFFLEVR